MNNTDLTDKANSTAYTDALNSANQKFVQVKGPGGAAKPSWVSIGASAGAATNTMSSANSGNAEQITITGLSVATSAATYSVTIDGTEITTSALTATSAGDQCLCLTQP